jgi:hypothetical protein
MRILGGIGIAVLIAGGAVAQSRVGFVGTPGITRGVGNVVFPGGTSSMGVQRTTGSVVYPGGGNPQIAIPSIPFSITDPNFATRLGAITQGRPVQNAPAQNGYGRRGNGYSNSYVYAYPVYVGGASYYDPAYAQAPQQQQQPNITIIYPPQQPTQVILPYATEQQPAAAIYEPPARPVMVEPERISEPSHYMIAFKDHSIYAAVAYWVDGETLHYFTTGNTHNQASVTLIDRELTDKLNRDTGLDVKLPPVR